MTVTEEDDFMSKSDKTFKEPKKGHTTLLWVCKTTKMHLRGTQNREFKMYLQICLTINIYAEETFKPISISALLEARALTGIVNKKL